MSGQSITAILVNLGTPEEPTAQAVKDFLRRFLSDRRVVSVNPLLWKPLLHGIILPLRSPKVAKLYQQIWTEKGSPLKAYCDELTEKVTDCVADRCRVRLAMSYSDPMLETVIQEELERGCEKLIILPLYPQYSVSTTAPVFDASARALAHQYALPQLNFIRQYYDHPGYCELLAETISRQGRSYGATHPLVFSYHGIPVRYAEAGDPYPQQCEQTSARVAQLLGLAEDAWVMSYQSRFGREPWLQPYTDETLTRLARSGATGVDIISPAFSVDCLETLEEISGQSKELFLAEGGQNFNYIPALNADDGHAQFLAQIILEHLPE